jgi:N6-L-threonylcarbamoyladenine synthase
VTLEARKPTRRVDTGAIVEVLVKKSMAAMQQTGLKRLVVAMEGANALLRSQPQRRLPTRHSRITPELDPATDNNGAMIAGS